MDCKVTTFCKNIHYLVSILIVKYQPKLHFVNFTTYNTFILLTFCTNTISFGYKSSEPPKKIPSPLYDRKRGCMPG